MKRAIASEMKLLGHMIHNHFERSIESDANNLGRITATNAWIIGYLAEHQGETVFQKDIEQKFGISKSTASKVISLMETKELVKRESVAGDARKKQVKLTPRAEAFVNARAKDFYRLEETLEEGFTADELDRLYEYIDRLKDNLSKEGLSDAPPNPFEIESDK